MSESKNNNYATDESRDPATVILFDVLMILGIGGAVLLISYIMMSAQAPVTEQAIADIKAEQVAEGSHYTAVVTAVDMTNGQVTLDNDHVVPTDLLKTTPHAGNVLAYTKTFDYELHERTGMPQKTDRDTFLNVQSVGHVSK